LIEPSSPSATDVVEDILAELKKKRRGVDLRALIRLQIRLARNWAKFDYSRAKQIHKAAKSAQTALEHLSRELQEAGLLRPAAIFRRVSAQASRWKVRGPHGSTGIKQRIVAYHAVLLISQCSHDLPSTTPSGNLHNIAWRIYREVFGPPPETKAETALLKACRKVLAWHRAQTGPKYPKPKYEGLIPGFYL
jgi:hypothetical protein